MSQTHPRALAFRALRAGVTAGAIGAALLVAPSAALAAPVVGPPIVPLGGTATVSDPNAAFNTTSAAVLLSQAACPSKFALAGANGLWNGTVTNRTSTAVTFTVPANTGPPTGTNGAAKAYFACVYEGAVQNISNLQAGVTLYVGNPPAVTPASGITGGGGQVTVTAGPNAPIFTGLTSVAAVFSSTACAATLGTTSPATMVATNVVRQSNTAVSLTVPPGVVSGTGGAPSTYNLCLYDGTAGAAALISFAPYTATVAAVSPANGSYLSSTGVTVTSPTAYLSGVLTPGALLIAGGGCPATYSTSSSGGATPIALTAPGSVRRLTNNRAALIIPPLPLVNGQPTTYQVCVYAGATSSAALVGSGAYTASVVAIPTAVLPAAGPAAGGNTITVVGTDFPTEPGRITATLGGVQLTNIQPVSDKAFTAQAPAHPVEENVALVVMTPAGTKALPGAYSYRNPIRVVPNTAPSTAPAVDVSVQGLGFLSINFGSAGTTGRVFLVNGVYEGADAGGNVRANGPVAECVNVLPLSDEELICTLQLNRRLNAAGNGFFDPINYSNTINDLTTTAGSRVVTSAQGRFHLNDVGQIIMQGGNFVPPNTFVTAVLGPNRALISAPALNSGQGGSTTIGGNAPVRTFTNTLTTTAGSTTVGLTTGTFTRADVGRLFSGVPGIPPGTTITAVAPGGLSATLSAPATMSTAGMIANVSISDGSPLLTSTALTGNEMNAVIGPNTLGIPAGTVIQSVNSGANANLSLPAIGGGTAANLPISRAVSGSLYAAAPVPDGSYNLVVVSNGAVDAQFTDSDYFQTDVTSSSAFTVASF